jgi:hypothetical protein
MSSQRSWLKTPFLHWLVPRAGSLLFRELISKKLFNTISIAVANQCRPYGNRDGSARASEHGKARPTFLRLYAPRSCSTRCLSTMAIAIRRDRLVIQPYNRGAYA